MNTNTKELNINEMEMINGGEITFVPGSNPKPFFPRYPEPKPIEIIPVIAAH